MFDSIRSHRRWLMFFMLVLIFPSFVFFGIQGYNRFMSGEGALATVDGTPITQQEFDIAQRDRVQRLQQQFGSEFDPKMLDTQEGRAAILDGILIDRALSREVEQSHIVITNDQLRRVLSGVPAFQEDGKFSMERYRAFIAAQGMSEPQFEERVRADLRKQLLVNGVIESAFVPAAVADRIDQVLLETREVRVLPFRGEQYLSKVSVADAQVSAFYDSHKNDFETPENVKIEYLVLSADALAGREAVTEADAKAFYEQNKGRYGTEEQRRASHILITPEGGDKEAARKKAEGILAALKANPGDFAKIAKEQSKDPGSAAQGGDLGFFGKGMMVKPFEDVAFKLKVGETSDIVETDFGFHIIRVTEIKPADARPFAEVRAEIERDLRTQKAQKHYAEAADQFTNLVYEQSDSLQPAADKLGLKIATRDNVTRSLPPAVPGQPQLLNQKIIDALFSEDGLKNRRNTQAIEVAPNTLVAARVVDYRPAAVRPFDEVKAAIRQRLEMQEAAKLARAAGEQKLAELLKQPSDTGFSPVITVSRRAPQGVPPALLNEVLRTRADKLPTYVGTDFEGAGYLIANVVAAKEAAAQPPAQREAERRALQRQAAAADEGAYADGLRVRHKAEVLKPEFRREPAKAPAAESNAAAK
ncbi:MAG TPA: SurA N-terminal domain-containing protein [Burkholderiaceae bacterium]|nr:SurA N-terminal domain-containing protein [Burkholderiaceae bacterium]